MTPNPDPLDVIDYDDDKPPDALPRRRDARVVLLAFAGMGLITLVAWMLQGGPR